MLTVGGFGRDTVERRRALSRPFCESTLDGCDGYGPRGVDDEGLLSGLMEVGVVGVGSL
jgi:hypothetical protein